jgi:hypothetical protein
MTEHDKPMTDFPSTMDYSLKKNAVASSMAQQVHYPINGSTINPADLPIITLSTGNYGNYLDPTSLYLSYTFNNTDGTNACLLDGSGYAVFDRIVVQSSGTVISDVQYYAPWSQGILDCQVGTGRDSTCSVSFGTSYDANLNTNRGGVSVASNGTLNICIPLLGTAIDASCSDKMIPVGACSDLQIMFYMASANSTVVTSSANASWKLTNFSLIADYVKIDAGAQRQLDEVSGGVYKWSGELWRGYQASAGASGDGSATVIVPFKGNSAKTIMSMIRLQANLTSPSAFTNTDRLCPFGLPGSSTSSSWFANVGAQAMPQIAIKNSSQHFMELLKGFHTLYNPVGFSTQFNSATWAVAPSATPATTATACGSFLLVLDLEAYSNKTNVIHSGVPITGGTTLSLVQTYANTLPAACVQNSWVHHDAILTVQNGIFSAVY